MGGLLAFRVGNFDNTAEREQFRFLCEQLKTHYENSNDFCVFAGNYNIGCELDALFIKKDAIISIEFKNYGGKVVANENGEWTCDGKIIKGGSRKTVLQQARINHSTVKNELKILGVEKNQIKDVPHLIIFHQPIELENNLSATNKSWLHITDNAHFIEKLDDITCPKTDFNPLGIVNLAELLNLNSFYLAEYSNANYEKPATTPEQLSIFEDIKTYEPTKTGIKSNNSNSVVLDSLQVNLQEEEEPIKENLCPQIGHFQTKEMMALRNYAEQIVCAVWGRSTFIINAIDHRDFSASHIELQPLIKQECIIVLEGEYSEDEKKHLQKFLNKEIYNLSNTSFFWQTGDYIGNNNYKYRVNDESYNSETGNDTDSNFVLPARIDDIIFNKLKAKYSPNHIKYEYNLNLSKEELLVYLGTYFPRSFTEVYILIKELLVNSNYKSIMGSKDSINILDLGCGTGGDIFGLLSFVERYLPEVKHIQILAIDGNHEALRIFEKVLTLFKKGSRLEIRETIGPVFVEEESDLDLISQVVSDNYDFILSCKAICEMLSKGRLCDRAYKKTATLLSKKLSSEGILLIEDVTIRIPATNEFIPKMLNKELNEFVRENPEFSTLAPFSCRDNGNLCKKGCFFHHEFSLSHSLKSNDRSKIVYRFICHKDFADKICFNGANLDNNQCQM